MTEHPEIPSVSIFDLVSPARVRRITMSCIGLSRITGMEDEDLLGAVYVRLLEAQHSPRSRYDATRGRSPASYVHMVASSVIANLTSQDRYRTSTLTIVDLDDHDPGTDDAPVDRLMVDRLLSLLDLPEERQVAMLLAGGSTILEIAAAMKTDWRSAAELRTRVRALLLPLMEEIEEIE